MLLFCWDMDRQMRWVGGGHAGAGRGLCSLLSKDVSEADVTDEADEKSAR